MPPAIATANAGIRQSIQIGRETATAVPPPIPNPTMNRIALCMDDYGVTSVNVNLAPEQAF